MLDASVAAALQRARATLEQRLPAGRPSVPPAPSEQQRALLERYLRAWEDADIDGFVALLREDAVLSMPPWRQWYLGRDAIGTFFAWTQKLGRRGRFRLTMTSFVAPPLFDAFSLPAVLPAEG